jgi:hypothetical protein
MLLKLILKTKITFRRVTIAILYQDSPVGIFPKSCRNIFYTVVMKF